MKITRVATAVVEANYDYTYVRIYCDRDGLYGTGESFFAPGLLSIIREMIPLLIGRDPREMSRLVAHLARKASGAGSSAGFVWNAISGIDAALHDLVGKIYGCPIYQLLGGKVRESVRVYADSHAGGNPESWTPMLEERFPEWLGPLEEMHPHEQYDPDAYARRACEVVANGFDALKFDLDSIVLLTGEEMNRPLAGSEIDRMAEIVRVTRLAVGPSVDLAFDCHWRFSPSDAVKIARKIEPFGVFWLEDPCPPDNWRQTLQVKQSCSVPILTGENLFQLYDFLPLFESQAVDLVAPDFQKCGGLAIGKRIADVALHYGVGLAPHCIASPIGLMASAHVCAASPNHAALEFHGQDVPFWDALADCTPIIQGGRVVPADAPGLGIELNEEVARRYSRKDESWFEEA